MGHRGEVSSVRFDAHDDKLTYFFNFKLTRNNDLFLNFVVSIKQEQSLYRPFRRHGVVVFEDQMPLFYQKMREALEALRRNKPYRSGFETTGGRSYQIFIRQQRGYSQLLCKESNQQSLTFDADMVSVAQELAGDFALALEKSFREWRRLRQQGQAQLPSLDTSTIAKVKVRKVVRMATVNRPESIDTNEPLEVADFLREG